MSDSTIQLPEAPDVSAAKHAALSYVAEAFAQAELDGLDPDCMAHAALFAAFRELVAAYGEDAVARYAESLPERLRAGGFSRGMRH